jgi:hypothetical protein
MNKTAFAFFAGAFLVFGAAAIWAASGAYQRQQEERRVMDFLTGPATKVLGE